MTLPELRRKYVVIIVVDTKVLHCQAYLYTGKQFQHVPFRSTLDVLVFLSKDTFVSGYLALSEAAACMRLMPGRQSLQL